MTDIIQELRGLIAEATPGEWALGVRSNQRAIAGGAGEWLALLPNGHREGFGLTSDSEIRANAALIVAAINHLPALLDRLEAAERVIDFLDMRRPINGIERRSKEEVFAIMADRIRLAEAGHYRLPAIREVRP
ncbi:hypothetical protein AX777_11430 [Sphingobium yanoikuyae]|uniref:Uncharacterized protein n=1 Tax=Sphingobium yanoikuyae TaxID=13690 RepID=A0A177JJ97_SPHYA|nr:hypothetical protein [Sphingobium yanoikuyae]OAH41290.1 hypothetical protein AX777_11430 [Sphingobium yanoikuyae]QJR01772.1 hypothetical protein HH800_05910 [Sphingobium yanoikuyae]